MPRVLKHHFSYLLIYIQCKGIRRIIWVYYSASQVCLSLLQFYLDLACIWRVFTLTCIICCTLIHNSRTYAFEDSKSENKYFISFFIILTFHVIVSCVKNNLKNQSITLQFKYRTCCNGLLFENWFMARDKVWTANFFLKYLCSERVFYLCREIRKGSQTTV